mmetsp:Transcript_65073/g.157478  ORF Transcript_65073/g.157478 Transcript_65073/m.157478 type:complete len:133 (+) Transcript_65073:1627-2025(+)
MARSVFGGRRAGMMSHLHPFSPSSINLIVSPQFACRGNVSIALRVLPTSIASLVTPGMACCGTMIDATPWVASTCKMLGTTSLLRWFGHHLLGQIRRRDLQQGIKSFNRIVQSIQDHSIYDGSSNPEALLVP